MADEIDRHTDWVHEVVGLARAAVGGGRDASELDRVRDVASDHGFRARLRDDDVLVLHPDGWLDEDGVLRGDVDPDEALEVPLGDSGGAEEARERNDELLDGFEREVGDEDVWFNVELFAEYCETHHGVAVDEVTARQLEEFVDEYYPRNVWASESAEEKLERSLQALGRYLESEDLFAKVDLGDVGTD